MTDHAHVEYGFREKTLPGYIVGLAGSVVLTLAAFALVYYKPCSSAAIYAIIAVLAIAQLIVQSICFLRLNASPEGRFNLLAFLFVIMMICFIAGGSMWIMYHLDAHIGWS